MKALYKHVFCFLIVALIALEGCGQKAVPKKDSALDQFYYAMETFYFPAEKAENDNQKKDLAGKAARALEAVWEYFPHEKSALVIMEAHFYQGICYKELGENEKAVEAFYACFSAEGVPATALDAYEAAMMSYKDDAWRALMGLREYLKPEYIEDIDGYKPLP